jgi:hypothetical protein
MGVSFGLSTKTARQEDSLPGSGLRPQLYRGVDGSAGKKEGLDFLLFLKIKLPFVFVGTGA